MILQFAHGVTFQLIFFKSFIEEIFLRKVYFIFLQEQPVILDRMK